MESYRIEMHSAPSLLFAHHYSTDSYKMLTGNQPDMIEITYIVQGNMILSVGNREGDIFLPTGSVLCLPYQLYQYRLHSDCFHHHLTAGIHMDYSVVSAGGLLLPHFLPANRPSAGLPGDANYPVCEILESLAMECALAPDSSLIPAKILSLFAKVSEIWQNDTRSTEHYGRDWYIARAKQYMISHISEAIRIDDIADTLKISAGYLSHMFVEGTGQSVLAYLQELRISRLETLVLHYGLTLQEAAGQTGIHDPNYASRLYRRIRGHSLSETKRMRNMTTAPPRPL